MTTQEIIDIYGKADRRTREIVFAFLLDILDNDTKAQLARFMSLLA